MALIKLTLNPRESVHVQQLMTYQSAMETANSLWSDSLWAEGDAYARMATAIQRSGRPCWDTVAYCDAVDLTFKERAAWLSAFRAKRPHVYVCQY